MSNYIKLEESKTIEHKVQVFEFFQSYLGKNTFEENNFENKIEYTVLQKYLEEYYAYWDNEGNEVDEIQLLRAIFRSKGKESSVILQDKITKILFTAYDNNYSTVRIRIEAEYNEKFEFYGTIDSVRYDSVSGTFDTISLKLRRENGKMSTLIIQRIHDDDDENWADDLKTLDSELNTIREGDEHLKDAIIEELLKLIHDKLDKTEEEKLLQANKNANVSDLNCSNVNVKTIKNNKENKMKDNFNSLMPQKISGGLIAMAMNGKFAVKTANGNYVSYNEATKQIEDYMDFVFGEDKIQDFCFLMPVDMKALKTGDIVATDAGFGFITDVNNETGDITCVNASGATKANLVPVKNVFTNTVMVKKLITLFDNSNAQSGGFNPMMFLLMGKNKDGKDSKVGNDDMMKMMLMSQMMGGANQTNGINPMMFAMMM
jgi:hypothetical protein